MTTQAMTRPAASAPESEPHGLWFLDSHVHVRVSQADNADGLSVLEHTVPFDQAPPRHVHMNEDEVFHVLAGEVRYVIGEVTTVARAGDTVLAPRGVPHGFRVTSREGARVLTITRGGFEAMVRSVSRPAGEAALPPAMTPTPEMQARLGQAALAQRIQLLGPPIA